MSRSYKKRPAVSGIIYNGSKRRANRRVRRALKNHDANLDNASYKKAYCSWDIRDYREVAPSFETFYKMQLDRWYNPRWHMRRRKETPPTREECLKLYRRWYVRK